MKFASAFFFATLSASVFASPINALIPVKERLRVSLWYEGVGSKQRSLPPRANLPESLERSLRKWERE